MRLKKIVSLMLLVCLLVESCPVCAAESFTIDKAVENARTNSSGLSDTKLEKVKKEIELKQARDGIADIRKKESTVRFSLLFNIKWPETHAMPKEIELIMKVPRIENEIKILKHKETYEALKSQSQGEQAYYDVLLAEENYNYINNRLTDLNATLVKIENQYKTGKGSKEDVDYLKNQIQSFEQNRQTAMLKLDTSKKKLSDITGIELRVGYTFEEYFPTVDISREQLDTITSFSKANDFTLFQKIEERKLAETDTDEILKIYKGRYGKYIGDIESYIKANENKKMDYEVFMQKYNHFLTRIDSPWANDFVINLIFFVIRIPKEWFKGEYSGARYLDDQKYALFVSLTERDKARKSEKDAITELENRIYENYSSFKQIQISYENSLKNLEQERISYEKMLADNRKGTVSFTSLESAKDSYLANQMALYEMKIEYSKQISAFNLATSGYVNMLLGKGEMSQTDLESGSSLFEGASWYVKNDLTQYTFAFGVNIPESYDVNLFQLYYQGSPVGEKTTIGETLIHLPFTYADSTLMELRLFNDSEHRYTALFDGGQYGGEVKLLEANVAEQELKNQADSGDFAVWSRAKIDEIRSELKVHSSTLVYDEYEIFYDDVSVGRVAKDKSIITLSIYLNDLEKLAISFYQGGGEIAKGSFVEGENSGKVERRK